MLPVQHHALGDVTIETAVTVFRVGIVNVVLRLEVDAYESVLHSYYAVFDVNSVRIAVKEVSFNLCFSFKLCVEGADNVIAVIVLCVAREHDEVNLLSISGKSLKVIRVYQR